MNFFCCLLAVGAIVASAGSSGPTGSTSLSSVVGAPRHSFAETQPHRRFANERSVGGSLTLPDLVERSDTIVAGETLDLRPSWNADRSEIFTTVILKVDRWLKGRGGETVRFRIPGGTVGDEWLRVPHAPYFALGEPALVFLRSGGGRLPTVVGMEAGKRHLAVGDGGSERILPEFRWSRDDGRPPVVVSTLDQLAAAVPRMEAEATGRRRD